MKREGEEGSLSTVLARSEGAVRLSLSIGGWMLSASARHYVSIDPIVRGGTRRGTPPPHSAVLNSWSMTLILPARAMQKGTLVSHAKPQELWIDSIPRDEEPEST